MNIYCTLCTVTCSSKDRNQWQKKLEEKCCFTLLFVNICSSSVDSRFLENFFIMNILLKYFSLKARWSCVLIKNLIKFIDGRLRSAIDLRNGGKIVPDLTDYIENNTGFVRDGNKRLAEKSRRSIFRKGPKSLTRWNYLFFSLPCFLMKRRDSGGC